jgi:hypothetical protein
MSKVAKIRRGSQLTMSDFMRTFGICQAMTLILKCAMRCYMRQSYARPDNTRQDPDGLANCGRESFKPDKQDEVAFLALTFCSTVRERCAQGFVRGMRGSETTEIPGNGIGSVSNQYLVWSVHTHISNKQMTFY